jgi:signal peptidase I
VISALWVGVIPALLAALALKYLVPPFGSDLPVTFTRACHENPVIVGVVCFLSFSIVLRYWRFSLPGGRYASSLPASVAPDERDGDRLREWAELAALYDGLSSRGAKARLARTLDDAGKAAFQGELTELEAGLETSDLTRARKAAAPVAARAAGVLAAKRRREGLRILGAAVAAAVIAGMVRATVVQPYRVISGSMLPTLEPGDQLAGNKLAFAGQLPQRGDVIIFRSSAVTGAWSVPPGLHFPDVLVKRAIGRPGDRIGMNSGVPVINGWEVPTCVAGDYLYLLPDGESGASRGHVVVEFLEDQAYLTVHAIGIPAFEGTYEVQPGEVFVLGDNRTNSVDSRSRRPGQNAGVPASAIEARGQWFLVGTTRSGDADLSRFFEPLDALSRRARTEGLGINTADLEAGVARCLAQRPSQTSPPPPSLPRTAGSSHPSPS